MQQVRPYLIRFASTKTRTKWFWEVLADEPDFLAMYVARSHTEVSGGGAALSVINAMVKRFKEGGRFCTPLAEEKAGWLAERQAAVGAAGGFGRPGGPTAAQVTGRAAGQAAGGRARAIPRGYGRIFVSKCENCGHISTATANLPYNQLCCPSPGAGGCGKRVVFHKVVCKVGNRLVNEGDAPLTVEEGFATHEDAAEALREMREAQAGGEEVTSEEQRELEAAVAELEAQEAAGPSSATGGGRGGGGAGPESPIDLTMEDDE